MLNFVDKVSDYFSSFYQGDRSYQLPQVVDLEAEMATYSLSVHQPEIASCLNEIITSYLPSTNQTIAQILTKQDICLPILHQLKVNNFNIYSGIFSGTSIILESPTAEGWLIKKNFSHLWMNVNKKISRVVFARNIPFWFFPLERRSFLRGARGVRAPNECINPLRVVNMRRARKCIKHFQLNRVAACKEYLLRLPHTSDTAPLHNKYVVVSKKVPILSERESLGRYIELAREYPEELKQIIHQICLVIKHTHLTDMHINNIRFAADGSNKVYLFDGEPVGGLIDVSQTQLKHLYKRIDFATFPVLGMRFLQENTTKMLKSHFFDETDIKKCQQILDLVINGEVTRIINDRLLYYGKIVASFIFPVIPLIVMIQGIARTFFTHK